MSELDELLFYDPEPCETCDSGIAQIETFDTHQNLCTNCVRVLARKRGWDELEPPEAVEEEKSEKVVEKKPDGLF